MNFLKASVAAATPIGTPVTRYFVWFAAGMVFVAVNSTAYAQTTYLEQSQAIKAPNAVARIGADLFGDQVNLYTGSLEFIQSDVSLRGNSALPVAVARRLKTNVTSASGIGQFGKQWELEIPRMHGIFSAQEGWSVQGGNPTARCSAFSEPPTSLYGGATWVANEFWQGNYMYIPGQGDQQLLARDPANNNVPSPASNYPVVTAKFWSISCLPALASASMPGEGFLAISPDGAKYRFDHLVKFNADGLGKSSAVGSQLTVGPRAELSSAVIGDDSTPAPEGSVGYNLSRVHVIIYPTEVADRFGNWVRYTYDPAKPGNLVTISSNDGRKLTFTYDGSDRITAVTDGTRTWTYTYSGANLATVTLPDASAWNLTNIYSLLARVNPSVGCEVSSLGTTSITGSMTHPSGATGQFTLTPKVHGRSDVHKVCDLQTGVPYVPKYIYTYSLTRKAITGPGLPASGYTWSYAYGPPNASWAPCGDGCPKSKTVSVTDPQQNVTRYTFGNQYRLSEGRLERVDTGWNATSSTAQRTKTTTYAPPGAGPYPNYAGYGGETIGDGEALARLMPVKQTVTTQQGTTFTWSATSFNVFAQATGVTRSSGLGYTRNESILYYNDAALWVLGQVERITESGGKIMLSNGYLPSANLGSVSKFGRLYQSMTYHSDGTLATRSDGGGNSTSFSNYKLGIPQNVSFPDGGSESALVNNIGGIDSTTDPYANTTSYYYDAMGRLSRIAYPGNDSIPWNDTKIDFERVLNDEYGLAPGHWRQTVSTGNGRTVEYLDAFWRPVLTKTFDIGDEAEHGA